MPMNGPLAGVLVLDLCHFLAGPYATAALADLGADVIKVEDPEHPDEARAVGPYYREQSLYFESLNWGKKSLALRLRHPEGRRLLLELVKRADVVIDNFKPGVMTRLGLSHRELTEANPRVVTCSLSGFGATGPSASRPGYDYTIQARAGVMSLTGEPDGPPGKAGISYVDHSGGLATALAATAALLERDRTGVGRHLDLSLYDVQISMLSYLASWSMNADYVPVRQPGGAHPSIVPAQNFATSDGHICLFVGNDPMWQRFTSAVGDPVLAAERFATNGSRYALRAELLERLQDVLLTRTTSAWLDSLAAADVPCEPVNSLAEALSDEQIRARSLVVTNQGGPGQRSRHTRGPVPLDDDRAAVPAPLLGADTEEVLACLGLDTHEMARLRTDGVVDWPTDRPLTTPDQEAVHDRKAATDAHRICRARRHGQPHGRPHRRSRVPALRLRSAPRVSPGADGARSDRD
jgi:crotonobetainyl-CoA:carnitine CoA-transferase CaiB-like acyl-CoA transferase